MHASVHDLLPHCNCVAPPFVTGELDPIRGPTALSSSPPLTYRLQLGELVLRAEVCVCCRLSSNYANQVLPLLILPNVICDFHHQLRQNPSTPPLAPHATQSIRHDLIISYPAIRNTDETRHIRPIGATPTNQRAGPSMDTNMEDVSQPTELAPALPTSEPATIPTLDGWIESLMKCKQLAEADVQRLCEKVCARTIDATTRRDCNPLSDQ